jgi:hypothetical protein
MLGMSMNSTCRLQWRRLTIAATHELPPRDGWGIRREGSGQRGNVWVPADAGRNLILKIGLHRRRAQQGARNAAGYEAGGVERLS